MKTLKLATKFGDKPSFTGAEDAYEFWIKTITARLGQSNVNLLMSNQAHALSHPKENKWFFHALQQMVQDGAAKHIINEFTEDQDGHAAMVAIREWREGEDSKRSLADNAQW